MTPFQQSGERSKKTKRKRSNEARHEEVIALLVQYQLTGKIPRKD